MGSYASLWVCPLTTPDTFVLNGQYVYVCLLALACWEDNNSCHVCFRPTCVNARCALMHRPSVCEKAWKLMLWNRLAYDHQLWTAPNSVHVHAVQEKAGGLKSTSSCFIFFVRSNFNSLEDLTNKGYNVSGLMDTYIQFLFNIFHFLLHTSYLMVFFTDCNAETKMCLKSIIYFTRHSKQFCRF